jgi:succinate dehydrogenase/fumarate reductase flavoprotein subunit
MASSFEHAGAQLADVAAQQNSLAAAVAAGQLWMDAGVAERAAARCDQAVEELDASLRRARELTRLRKFGDNEDGRAAGERFAQAGRDYIKTMQKVQEVFRNIWLRPTGS